MLDLLIKNAKQVNGQIIDIAIQDGKITKVGEGLDADATEIFDLKEEHYISAGWIDAHVHAYEKLEIYADNPDEIGIKTGVTTVIDAGTSGAENVADFYAAAQKVKTNVYALLNISSWGLVQSDELADLSKIQADLVKKAVREHPDFIVGLKARMSKSVIGENGLKPLHLAKEMQKEIGNLPLMIHVGSAPPELDEMLKVLDKGDVMTHCFNGKDNGILDRSANKIKPFAWEAFKQGVVFDIGHGIASFDFDVSETAFGEGMKAHSISTDIYSRNRINGPVYDFATTMEKLRVVGYTWEEIIEKVTAAPADAFYLKGKGQLKEAYDADLTIFDIVDGEKDLIDSSGNHRTAKELIKPLKTIIGGVLHDINL